MEQVGEGGGEIYINLSLQTNFLKRKLCIKVGIIDAFANKRCKNKPIRFAMSVCPQVSTRKPPNGIHEIVCQWITKICHEQTPTLVKIGQKRRTIYMRFCAHLANHSPVTGRIIIGAKHAWKNAVEETHILCPIQFFHGS